MRRTVRLALVVTCTAAAPVVAPAPSLLLAGSGDFCSGPQSADAFPGAPVPVEEDSCHYFQRFQATSPNASYGGTCSGYTVAFGPKGGLKHPVQYFLTGEWGEALPSDPVTCAQAHVSAVAWGYRCDNRPCTVGAWEQIAAEQNQAGGWNEVSHTCYLGADFSTVAKNYQTVQIVVLAYHQSRDGKQQARAKGEIYAYRGNGLCNSAEANSPPRRPRP